MTSLILTEELLLLALHDTRGSFYASVSSILPYGLIGAEILELLLSGRLMLKNKYLTIADPSPTGDTIKDDILTRIGRLEKLHTTDYWVGKLAREIRHLKKNILESLENRCILQSENRSLLGIFTVKRYMQSDPSLKEAIKERLHNTVIYELSSEPGLICLLALTGICGLIRKLFNGEERKMAQRMIKDWMKKEAEDPNLAEILNAVKKAITAAQAASTASTI